MVEGVFDRPDGSPLSTLQRGSDSRQPEFDGPAATPFATTADRAAQRRQIATALCQPVFDELLAFDCRAGLLPKHLGKVPIRSDPTGAGNAVPCRS